MTEYTPHPYALMLPALTEDEYTALKSDIAEHGILYPIIVDDEGKVLDGVHRLRIASELGIDLPVSRHDGLTDDRKLHLAVGLNMRRRHLDSDRRGDLVRKLHTEQGLSLRKIASITGWSKSTIDRDLKPEVSQMGQPVEERSWDELFGEAKELMERFMEAQARRADRLFKAVEDNPGRDDLYRLEYIITDCHRHEAEVRGYVATWKQFFLTGQKQALYADLRAIENKVARLDAEVAS